MLTFYEFISFDGLVKSRHPGERRGPDALQLLEKTGFRLSPEWRKSAFFDFLRGHQFLSIKKPGAEMLRVFVLKVILL